MTTLVLNEVRSALRSLERNDVKGPHPTKRIAKLTERGLTVQTTRLALLCLWMNAGWCEPEFNGRTYHWRLADR